MSRATNTDSQRVTWEHVPYATFESPVSWTGPYVECKLEHPQLEPTCLGERFFPDSVPYQAEAEQRVFYWRNRLSDVPKLPEQWSSLCASPHELVATTEYESCQPTLFQATREGYELIVDGTIVGDSKTAFVSQYQESVVELLSASKECVEFRVGEECMTVESGDRDRITLPERTVETEFGTPIPVRPELEVRYPGVRTVYHPAPASSYHLFPSFSLDIEEISRTLDVPTTWGELNQEELANILGIDITSQPYPERILWRAFAFTAFDPHSAAQSRMTQFPDGKFAIATGRH